MLRHASFSSFLSYFFFYFFHVDSEIRKIGTFIRIDLILSTIISVRFKINQFKINSRMIMLNYSMMIKFRM